MSNVGEGRRVAIIGAGPSGFYAAEQLLTQGFEVDLLDLLPTPFGLVRAGVAPDHPKIKSVTRMYEKTARKDGFRFFGGVQVGEDVRRAELLERYHAVLYAVGTGSDNRLGIPGEDRPGSYPATRFVAWYNGHPHACDDEYDLSATRAVVVGNGNVAIDIARMLVLDPDELAPTDTADHALAGLAAAQVEEVVILGRRGPAQAAFTNPELRELGELTRADVDVDPADLELDAESLQWLETEGDPTAKRNVELLREFAARVSSPSSRSSGFVNAACAGPRRPSRTTSRTPEALKTSIAWSAVSVAASSSGSSTSMRATSTATLPLPITTARSADRSNVSSQACGWPLYQATNVVAGYEPGRSSPGTPSDLSVCAPVA